MTGNPYSEMARVFTSAESGFLLRFGIITGVSPLVVNVGGLTVSGDALFCNAELLSEPQKAEIHLPGCQIAEPSGCITLPLSLKVGDRVLLYSDHDQVFYILCKVVST